jgi:hypothetical protein
MQLINHFKNTWMKPVKTKDRFQFSLVLLVLLVIYYYSRYIKHHIIFNEYQWEVYTLLIFLVSFVVIDFWGNYIVRLWLTISGTFGKLIFGLLLLLVYFLILSPLFLVVNAFSSKRIAKKTNWTNKVYLNKDYNSMG